MEGDRKMVGISADAIDAASDTALSSSSPTKLILARKFCRPIARHCSAYLDTRCQTRPKRDRPRPQPPHRMLARELALTHRSFQCGRELCGSETGSRESALAPSVAEISRCRSRAHRRGSCEPLMKIEQG